MRLAQKYRPSYFDAVIGQDATVTVLKAIISRSLYQSAYLFSGPYGTGKTTIGRIFSMAILCEHTVDGNPCGTCESCKMFLEERHFGYSEMDAASFGGKDDMIKIRDDAAFTSATKKKIILLDECHDISRQGQDALLKQVERCPEHLIYMFCTTEPDQMKPELRDRCMEFQIYKVDHELTAQRLKFICEKEGLQYDEPVLRGMAEMAGGHVRSAINFLEKTALIGPIIQSNFGAIYRDCDQEIVEIIANLGIDLDKALSACKSVSAYLSPSELYDRIISLLGDASKLLYDVGGISPRRLQAVTRLKDVHGFSLMEFLNYLLARDKYVDRVGLQSDIVILHYKYGAKNFVPTASPQNPFPQIVVQNDPQKISQPAGNQVVISYSDLQRMTVRDRSIFLSNSRRMQKPDIRKEPERISSAWPLPKVDRPGMSSPNESLSPQEFSRGLVGGRTSDKQSVGNP